MKTIARYEAKGGKQYLELIRNDFNGKPSYEYQGNGCGGNMGYKDNDEQAIECFENNQVKYLKMDYPSTKRIF